MGALTLFILEGSSVWAQEDTSVRAQEDKCKTRTDYLKYLSVPFIDDVPYATKPLLLQRYGARLTEKPDGPILIKQTNFSPYTKDVLIWSEVAPISDLKMTGLRLELNLANDDDSLPDNFAVIIVNGGTTQVYSFGDQSDIEKRLKKISEDKKASNSDVPSDLSTALHDPIFSPLQKMDCNRYVSDEIGDIKKNQISHWGLFFIREDLDDLQIASLGLTEGKSIQPPFQYGQINDSSTHFPGVVLVEYENGVRRQVTPSHSGNFVFEDEFPEDGMRISYKKREQENYPDRGRWIGANRNVGKLNITLKPEHSNIDAHLTDEGCKSDRRLRGRQQVPEMVRPGHYLQYWCGTRGTIQELSNTFFANFIGMHDKDFTLGSENKECLRIAYLGHSAVQAKQVPLYLKHNVLEEEFLSLVLQQCVEVNTFGGNFSVTSEPRIEWIMENYNPDLVIFALHRQMVQLLTPDLLHATFGYRRGHAHIESFNLKPNGDLEYIPADPRYSLVEKDDPSINIKGYPLSLSYNLPLDVMPDLPRGGFETTEALLQRYKDKFPDKIWALDYSHTVAECDKANYCKKSVEFEGKRHLAGAEQYIRTMNTLCENAIVICIDSPIPGPELRGFPEIVFQFDAHYTKLGNYWLAKNVTKSLSNVFHNETGKNGIEEQK